MDDFSMLGSVARRLHQEFCNLYYLLLPIFFSLSLVITWLKHPAGSPEFIEALKRAFIATLLLVGFPEISDTILFVANGISQKISDMDGLNSFLQMAAEKAHSYPKSPLRLLQGFNDLIIAALSILSYMLVYFARYIMVALYHFTWCLLSILSPLLLLFHLFTPRITLNLFTSLIEVACWQIVWAILSAMLTALPFGQEYLADGNYLTVIILNFVIALAMLGTPFIVRSFVGGGLAHVTGGMAPVIAGTILAAPTKAVSMLATAKTESGLAKGALKTFNSAIGQGHRISPPPKDGQSKK